MHRTLLSVALLLPALGLAGCGHYQQDMPLLQGPPAHEYQLPYHEALGCVKAHLTSEQSTKSFGVLKFPDLTGQANYAAENSTGTFSTQGGAVGLQTALADTGVRVVDIDPTFLNFITWELDHGIKGFLGDGHNYQSNKIDPATGKPIITKSQPVQLGSVAPVDYIVSGGFTTLDFLPGWGVGVSVGGIGPSYSETGMIIGLDMTTKTGVTGPDWHLGGVVVAHDNMTKQMRAYQSSLGVASFFSGPSFIQASIGNNGREAVQLGQRAMLDRVAYDAVTQTFGIHACEPYIAAAEKNLAPSPPPVASASHQSLF